MFAKELREVISYDDLPWRIIRKDGNDAVSKIEN